MNHDFDDEELGRSGERRSRKNPRMRDDAPIRESGGAENGAGAYRSEKERWESRQRAARQDEDRDLDVLGDSSVHPIPPRPQSAGPRPTYAGETGSRTAGSGSRAADGSGRAANGARQASRQSAAAAADIGGGALPRRIEEQIAKRKKKRRIVTMIVAECFALLFIFSYAFFAKKWNMVQRPEFEAKKVENNNLEQSVVEKMKGYWTIAIFGVDARDKAIAKGTNADVNLICNVNLDTGEIKLVSVFRDTYLNISDKGTYNKINQAYFLGGPEQAVSALNQNLDLNIQSYMTFNWKAVADAINILGGVDIELSKAEFYYINSFITETVKVTGIGSTQLKKAGMNHLDGVQAVAYGRLRLMDTDYARTERQRKVIAQAFEKAKKADIGKLNTIIGTVFPQVATNIGVDDLVKNATVINKFHIGETTGFPQSRGDANMGKKGAVVVPTTLESNVVKLHQFLFGDEAYTPSKKVKSISDKIASDTGLYKEGQYVSHVTTEGGVIQPPKTTAAPKKESDKDDKGSIYETDEDGNYIYETDEDGDYVYETDENGKKVKKKVKKKLSTKETDEDGNPVKETTVSGKPGTTREPETDEDGNPIETSRPSRPGETAESHTGVRPGDSTEPTSAVRPGDTTEPTTSNRPGGPTESASPTPGGTTNTPYPGGTTEPTAPTSGNTTGQAPGSSSTPGGDNSGPSQTTAAQEVPNFPGGQSQTPGGTGPGGQDSVQNIGEPMGGTVSAPGQ